jgi:hypothetical protein
MYYELGRLRWMELSMNHTAPVYKNYNYAKSHPSETEIIFDQSNSYY